jgi:hypothetical protein
MLGYPLNTSTRLLQTMEHAGKRTEPEGDPSNPEIDPATRRELENRIAELSKENAVLEKVVFARLPIQFIWNPSAMTVLLVSSIIAFQPGTSQQRTRRRDEQDSFRRFERVAHRVQSTVDGTRSLRWLGGAPSRRFTREGRLSPGEGQRGDKTPSRGS